MKNDTTDTKETTTKAKIHQMKSQSGTAGAGNAVYGIGIIGALVYYFQVAHSFGAVMIGILKAIFWPGFLVYEAFKYLHL
jgi:hypothetical protein